MRIRVDIVHMMVFSFGEDVVVSKSTVLVIAASVLSSLSSASLLRLSSRSSLDTFSNSWSVFLSSSSLLPFLIRVLFFHGLDRSFLSSSFFKSWNRICILLTCSSRLCIRSSFFQFCARVWSSSYSFGAYVWERSAVSRRASLILDLLLIAAPSVFLLSDSPS